MIEEKPSQAGRTRIFASLAAAVPVFCLYFWTLPPTVTGGDSGELISAAYCMGVPHPPGYPLWALLVKIWMTVLPFGEVAWRVNLFSAICGSLAVLLLVQVAYEIGLSTVAAIAAGLVFGFSQTFWSQSIIAKFYPFSMLVTLSCIYFVLRYENTRQTKYVYIAALLFGLAFVAHQTAMLLAPPILLLMLSRGKGQLILRPGRLALALLISALPLLLFLYLMVRAKANPPSNWGDPNDLHRLWIHFTRQQYPSELTKNARSWMLFAGQMRLLARDVFTEFSPFLLAFIPIGILGMWKAGGWRKAIFFFAIALIPTVGFMLILSPPLEREIINSVRVFHLYAWAATALFIAAAIDHIGAQDPVSNLRSWARGAFLWTLALSLSLVVCLSNYSAVNMRGNYLAYDYARNTLASLAPDAIIFPGGDTNTFPMLYCTIVEGLRPDVAIADKYGYIEKSMYRDMPGKPPEVENREMRLAITKWIVEHTKRPVYFDTPPNLPGVRIKPEGLVFRIADGAAGRQREVWDAYKWHNIDGDKFPLKTEDYDSQTIMADYCTMRAHYYLGKGMRYEARDMIKRAAGYGWGVKELLNNLGGMAAENNFLELAETLLQQAVEIDSAYATPRRNLEMLHNQMRRSMEEATQPDRFTPRPSLPPQTA